MVWQTIITAAGVNHVSFEENNIAIPKNLIPFQESTILNTAIRSYSHGGETPHVVIRKEEDAHWGTVEIIEKTTNRINFHLIQNETRGALCTAAMALDNIESGKPLVIAPGDSYIDGDLSKLIEIFESKEVAAGTLLFQDSHQRWSFARLGQECKILEMAEKSPISHFASTGLFYFRSPELFIRAAEWVLRENMNTGGEFYLSTALNYLIMNGENVLGIELPSDFAYTPLSRFSDLQTAKKDNYGKI